MLGYVSRGKTREIKIIAAVAYIHPQKARFELIAGTTDFEIMMRMREIGPGVPNSKAWRKLMRPFFKYLWSKNVKEKEAS